MFWIAPSVETGDHHDPLLFYEEEEPVREPTYSGPPPSVFHYRIMHRGGGDCLDSIHHRLHEPLRKFRADTLVTGQCFFKFRVRFRQPDYRERHSSLTKPALTRSHEMTSEGFCSYLATR